MCGVCVVSDLDAILGSFLEVGDDGMVPQVNEPRAEILHSHRTGEEETRPCEEGGKKERKKKKERERAQRETETESAGKTIMKEVLY